MLHAAHRQEIISYSAVELWLLGSCVASRANHSEVLQWAWRPAQPLLYRFAQFLVQLQHVDMLACATVAQFVQFGDAPPCKELAQMWATCAAGTGVAVRLNGTYDAL